MVTTSYNFGHTPVHTTKNLQGFRIQASQKPRNKIITQDMQELYELLNKFHKHDKSNLNHVQQVQSTQKLPQ